MAPLRPDLAGDRFRGQHQPARSTPAQISARIEQLLENPRQPRDSYDQLTDQWTTTYGDGSGLIVYAVVHERQRVIILRLV